MRLHLVELVLFSTYAELRAERARSYLGLLWWIVEPAMNMGVYYLVFAVIFRMGGPDYIPFLLIGLTLWQWFKSCISHGGYSIWQQLPLVRQVKLPLQVFPSVQILADTVKFLCILAILLVVLWCTGYPPNVTYIALLPVLLSAADAMVLPSASEGLANAWVEALACGCPVASSDAGSLPEVLGDAAVLFDPGDASAISAGVAEALERADELSALGPPRAAAFTWEATARAHDEVYALAGSASSR